MNVMESGAVGGFDKGARIAYLNSLISGWSSHNRQLTDTNAKLRSENKEKKEKKEKYKTMITQIKAATGKLSEAKSTASGAGTSYKAGYTSSGSIAKAASGNISAAVAGIGGLIGELNGVIPAAQEKMRKLQEDIDKNKKQIESNEKIIKENSEKIANAQREIQSLL